MTKLRPSYCQSQNFTGSWNADMKSFCTLEERTVSSSRSRWEFILDELKVFLLRLLTTLNYYDEPSNLFDSIELCCPKGHILTRLVSATKPLQGKILTWELHSWRATHSSTWRSFDADKDTLQFDFFKHDTLMTFHNSSQFIQYITRVDRMEDINTYIFMTIER